MSELEPCAHCGSTDLYEIEEKDDLKIPQPAIFCNTCKTTFTVEDDSQTLDDEERMKYLKQKVKSAWNRRTVPENKPLTLEQLKQRIHKPVFIIEDDVRTWTILESVRLNLAYFTESSKCSVRLPLAGINETWFPYAREPVSK